MFDGEKCVLLLCAWKPAFLRSGHIFCFVCVTLYVFIDDLYVSLYVSLIIITQIHNI